MPDFNIRSESVDVEQIMEQIRARIREKRGVDYTEQQIRELAAVKLEKLLDPRGVRSDLLERFRRVQADHEPPAPPNYAFEEATLYETHRGPIRWIRRLLNPLLKLFFNPNPLIQALNIQSRLNTLYAQREATRRGLDELHFEVMHNLVMETTRLGIEVKNLKMRVESLASRLDFSERRARALEGAVVYKPANETRVEPSEGLQPVQRPRQAAPSTPQISPGDAGTTGASAAAPGPPGGMAEGPGQRSRRRRRRRGRRGGGTAGAPGVNPGASSSVQGAEEASPSGTSAVEPAGHIEHVSTTEPHTSEPHAEAAPRPDPAHAPAPGTGGSEPQQQ